MSNEKQARTYVLSVGGSLLVPDKIDIDYLKSLIEYFSSRIENSNDRFIIVCGGGKTCRNYLSAVNVIDSFAVTEKSLDAIGIAATKLNAELVLSLFSGIAYDKVLVDPTVAVETDKQLFIAGGWKPGATTDNVAVRFAKTYGADLIINLSNIDGVYDSNPKENPNAVHHSDLLWKDFFSIIGTKRVPGGNWPFDPVASKFAEENNLAVIVADGKYFELLDSVFNLNLNDLSSELDKIKKIQKELFENKKIKFTILHN